LTDTLIKNALLVLTMDANRRTIPSGDLLLRDGVIAAVGVGLPAQDPSDQRRGLSGHARFGQHPPPSLSNHDPCCTCRTKRGAVWLAENALSYRGGDASR